jgi:hypothetical protein
MAHDEGEEKKKPTMNRLKELRSAFQGLTVRAPRLTGRAAKASGQSLVRSFTDRTHPVRGDRTQTESGQRSTLEQLRVTGRADEV